MSGISCVPCLRVDQNDGMPARPFMFLKSEENSLELLLPLNTFQKLLILSLGANL